MGKFGPNRAGSGEGESSMTVLVEESYLCLEWPIGITSSSSEAKAMRRSDFVRLARLMMEMSKLASPDRMQYGDIFGDDHLKMHRADLAA